MTLYGKNTVDCMARHAFQMLDSSSDGRIVNSNDLIMSTSSTYIFTNTDHC